MDTHNTGITLIYSVVRLVYLEVPLFEGLIVNWGIPLSRSCQNNHIFNFKQKCKNQNTEYTNILFSTPVISWFVHLGVSLKIAVVIKLTREYISSSAYKPASKIVIA